ncbi:MAG: hypothetical protein IIW34_08770 [Clostridia bacterium]|nr:hypothetical protein [Clostridia bacterium]
MGKYAIWNKQDDIITPRGEIFSANQWMTRYPVAQLDDITIVCGGGVVNGSFFGILGQMVDMYEKMGADFSACTSDEDKLAAIEAFEDARNAPSGLPTAEERQAAALEAIASGATSENSAAMDALLGEEEDI